MRNFLLIVLVIFLLAACKSQPHIAEDEEIVFEVIESIVEIAVLEPELEPVEEIVIEILEPEFIIVSILVLQADLVVTDFEATLRIENPNEFDIDLSSLTYELYVNGAFWANGRENNVLHVPANSSKETKFIFSMNFIDMSRSLLNDVIAMRQLGYRFRGQAQMQPDILNIPVFLVNYDCTGISEVRRR